MGMIRRVGIRFRVVVWVLDSLGRIKKFLFYCTDGGGRWFFLRVVFC